uniref:alcohol dehydrogenase n=1 Tax=Panagrellus redivivus TaxID=6233 RepID=A0A7E4VP40_PANRE
MVGSLEIPKTQKALVYHQVNGPLVIEEVPVPEPEFDDLLVKVLYSGVCHSDVHIWMNELPLATPVPQIGGHEGAGIVVKVGKHVKGFAVGDRAGIKWINGSCLICEHCKSGTDNLCVAPLNSGFTRNGTFQQYALVKASEAAKIPDGVDLAQAAPILCAGITAYHGLTEANLKPGQTVAITGAGGGLGSFAVQYAKAMGYRILAIDATAKEDHCRSLGADLFVDPFTSKDIVQEIQALTNGGPHAVLNLAPVERAIKASVQYVRTKGTVVLVSLPKDAKLEADIFWTVFKAITIKGSFVGSRQDADEALDFVRRGLVKIPLEVITLEDVPKAFERLEKGLVNGRIVVDLFPGESKA